MGPYLTLFVLLALLAWGNRHFAPEGASVQIKRGSWPVLPIFELMQRIGNIEDAEMFRTFNMGIGMVVVCAQTDVSQITSKVRERGFNCFEIGRVNEGARNVVIE